MASSSTGLASAGDGGARNERKSSDRSVMIPVRLPGEEQREDGSDQSSTLAEWVVVELQGEVVSKGGLSGQELGTLVMDGEKPILTIGKHMLEGKEQKLEQPFLVTRKRRLEGAAVVAGRGVSDDGCGDEQQQQQEVHSSGEISHAATEYVILGKVCKKIHFKQRPKPVIASQARQTKDTSSSK